MTNYDLAVRATHELDTAEKVRLIQYLTGSIADGDDSTITPGAMLIPGQALLGDGGTYLTIDNVEPSSAMPGFMAVETEAGTLYLDPEIEFVTLD